MVLALSRPGEEVGMSYKYRKRTNIGGFPGCTLESGSDVVTRVVERCGLLLMSRGKPEGGQFLMKTSEQAERERRKGREGRERESAQ